MFAFTTFEAKSNFSELLRKARSGETVLITSGRDTSPVARLEAIRPKPKKRLGALLTPGFTLTPAFFQSLPEEELRLWKGEGE